MRWRSSGSQSWITFSRGGMASPWFSSPTNPKQGSFREVSGNSRRGWHQSGTRPSPPPAQGSYVMAEHVYKKIEIVGVSANSPGEAVGNAIQKAAETLHNLDWFEVTGIRGYIKDKKPVYQVEVKIGFRLD